jgi:hypothetical protein
MNDTQHNNSQYLDILCKVLCFFIRMSAIMLRVIRLSAIRLSVINLNVVAPSGLPPFAPVMLFN